MIRFKVHYIIFQHVNHTKNIKREDLDEQRRRVLVSNKHHELEKQRKTEKKSIFTQLEYTQLNPQRVRLNAPKFATKCGFSRLHTARENANRPGRLCFTTQFCQKFHTCSTLSLPRVARRVSARFTSRRTRLQGQVARFCRSRTADANALFDYDRRHLKQYGLKENDGHAAQTGDSALRRLKRPQADRRHQTPGEPVELIVEEIHPNRRSARFCARTFAGDHYAAVHFIGDLAVHFPHRSDDNGRRENGRAICELVHDRAVFKAESDESFATLLCGPYKLPRRRLRRKITSKLHAETAVAFPWTTRP